MRLDAEGVNLIAGFEGFVGHPYNDAAGYATVGYGHLLGYRHVTQNDIIRFRGWTQADYKRLLRDDCARFEQAVRSAIHVPLTQGEFNALVSLAFNCGPGAVQGNIARLANAGHKDQIPSVMRQYVRANGQVLRGLVDRREREIAVFREHSAPAADPHRSGVNGTTVSTLADPITSG